MLTPDQLKSIEESPYKADFPLLAKNPEVADWLVQRAIDRRAAKNGTQTPELPPLDDAEELAANQAMLARLGVHRK